MGKFIMECPNCGGYVQVSDSILAKKKISCACGYVINVKTDRITIRKCSNCGNNVVVDQSKKDSICTVCKKPINSSENLRKVIDISCPTCNCTLKVDKAAQEYQCPICDTNIDVQQRIAQAKMTEEGIVSLIKYEGDNTTLVWKHPIEDFNMGSQLIVHESQEALFFRNGQALDLFSAGRYTLETQELPILNNIFKLPTGQDGTFHSEVYFINQTVQMGIKWGTDIKVRLFDPISGLHLEIGASGEFNLKVLDSRKVILKLVGTTTSLRQNDILAYFRSLIMTQVKSNLAKTIKERHINILEIDEYLNIISDDLKEKINPFLENYGLIMPELYVMRIVHPDDKNYEDMRNQHAQMYLKVREENIKKAEAIAAEERMLVEAERNAKLKVIEAKGSANAYAIKAEAEAKEMQMKGYTYSEETARKVGMNVANGSGGNGLGDILGLGIGLGAINSVVGITKDAININNNERDAQSSNAKIKEVKTWDCSCGNKGISVTFCGNCGAKRPEEVKTWDCSCGNKGISGKFCGNCGAKKPEEIKTWDCSCGNKRISGKFCGNCGAKKPEEIKVWDCSCGNKGISGKFCSECGAKKPEEVDTWDCSCGNKGISDEFCPKCNSPRNEN